MANGTEVGSLYYDIGVDNSNLTKGLDQSSQSVQSFGDKTSSVGTKIKDSLNAAAKVLAVVGAGLTAYAKNAVDTTVSFEKSSHDLGQEIGVSTSKASELTAAFQHMGVSADQSAQMFGIFSKQIVASTTNATGNQIAFQKLQIQMQQTQQDIVNTTTEISKNGDKTGDLSIKLKALNNDLASEKDQLKQSTDSFQKLGISTTDVSGNQKDFNTLLLEVADKFKTLPDGVDKTTIALDLFGRSGKDMIKTLDLGSQGIQNLENQADKLGIALTPGNVNKIQALITSQKALKDQTDALKISVGTTTAPVLTLFNTKLNDILGSLMNSDGPMRAIISDFLAFGGPVAAASAGAAAFVGNLSSISGEFIKVTAGFSIFAIIVGGIALILYEIIQNTGGWQAALKRLKPFMDDITQWFKDVKKFGVDAFQKVRDNIDDVYAVFTLLATGKYDGGIFGLNPSSPVIQALDHIHAAFSDIWAVLQLIGNFVASNFVPVMQGLWQVLQFLWPSIEAVFAAFWKDLLPAFEQVTQAVGRLWNALNPALMDVLKAIAIIIGVAVVGAIWLFVNVLSIGIQAVGFLASSIADVVGWIANLAGWFGTAMSAAGNFAASVIIWFSRIPGAVSGIVGNIVDFFKGLPKKIGDAMGDVASIIEAPFKVAFDAIAKFWNDTVGKLSFSVPSWVPGLGGKGFSMPKLPILDAGGIISKPTIAMLSANSRPEAVIPLDKLGKMGNTYMIDKVNLTTAEATNAFFAINDRNIQLESMGLSPMGA